MLRGAVTITPTKLEIIPLNKKTPAPGSSFLFFKKEVHFSLTILFIDKSIAVNGKIPKMLGIIPAKIALYPSFFIIEDMQLNIELY